MKKIAINLILFLLAICWLEASMGIQADEKLFKEAKILLFDKEWAKAQEILEEILKDYPESRWYTPALFYKGKCLAEQKGQEVQALAAYNRFIGLRKADKNLIEEAENSIVDLAFSLYTKGKKSYLNEIEKRLESRNDAIRYYAAYKLSFVKDKKIAGKGLPVLKEFLKEVKDDELKDRVKLAILRIDPAAMEDYTEERERPRARMLYIRVFRDGKRTFSLGLPWALADLALGVIPEKEKAVMRKEGYDVDKIIEQLLEFRGDILEIQDEEEGILIKVWIK